MNRSILIAAAFSITALVAGAAHADDRARIDQERAVSTAKTDFNTPSQVKMLYKRIATAAEAVCHSEISDPITANEDAACARQAVSDAVREINAPQLSALDGQAGHHASAYAMTGGQH